MGFEKFQKRGGKQAHCQKRQDKSYGVNADQPHSRRSGFSGGCHNQNAGQCRPYAGSPGKTERKAHHKSGKRRHRQPIQPQRKAPLLSQQGRSTEQPSLIKAEQDYDDPADSGKQHLIRPKKHPGSRHSKSQNKKSKADSDYKKYCMEHYLALLIMNTSVCPSLSCSS